MEDRFVLRNLLANTSEISSSNPFYDFDSHFRFSKQRVLFVSLFVFPAAALISLTFLSYDTQVDVKEVKQIVSNA